MLRPNLIAILQARGAPFTIDELQNMREGEAWEWVRRNCPVKARPTYGNQFEVTIPGVCFSGMAADARPMLSEYAILVGFQVCTKMSQIVDYLVVGEKPGPYKLEYAKYSGIDVIPVEEFVTRAEEFYSRAMENWPCIPPAGYEGQRHGRIPKRIMRKIEQPPL